MSRTPRALLRTLTTVAISVALLAMTALPALAASGTKPDPTKDEFLVGSLDQLVTTAIVGVAVAVVAWVLMPAKGEAATEDDHH